MDYQEVQVYVDVAQFVMTGAVGVYIYFTNKHDKTDQKVAALESDMDRRLDAHGERIAELEGSLKSMPTHGDMTDVKTALSAVRAENQGQTELLRRLTTQVDVINEWLVKRAK